MDINYLIVSAPNVPNSDPSILIEPVDALTLATWAQHNNNSVEFIDLDRFGVMSINNTKLKHYSVAIVVFDYLIPLYSAESVEVFEDLFYKISKLSSCILLVGRLASFFPKDVLDKFPMLYGCIVGEPETTLTDLFRHKNLNLLDENSDIVTQKNKSINPKLLPRGNRKNIYELIPQSGPIANRELCNFDDYIDVHSIISSRGCNGCCKFCSTNGYLGPWRAASPEMVISEMQHLVSLGAHKIIFLDDNFSNDRYRVVQICESIKRNKIVVTWGAYVE